MDDAVYWELLVAIRDQLRTNVAYPSVGSVKGIPAENIVIRMAPPYGRKDDDTFWQINTPGIVICPSRTVTAQSKGGSWNLDMISYPIMIQLVDGELSSFNDDRMRAWLKWQEMTRKYLIHSNLKLAVFQDKGHVDITYIPTSQVLDDRLFYVHGRCVSMLYMVAQSLEPRNPLSTN